MTQAQQGPAEVFRTRDLAGWDVVDRAGEKVGSVADLLVDRQGVVRFVDVEYGLPRKHFLVPAHDVAWGEEHAAIGAWTRDELRALPPYTPGAAMDGARMEDLRRAYPWAYGDDPEEWRVQGGDAGIVPLSEARDFKLPSGAPDPRGWNVFGSDGERLGTVTHLLVDPAAMKIRYLDVDLHDDLFPLDDDRHVLVPLELVELRERGNDVWVQGLEAAEIAKLPAYPGGAVRPALQRAVERAFETRA